MPVQVLGTDLGASGTISFTPTQHSGGYGHFDLYSIGLIGDEIENFILVAINNRANWQKYCYQICNDIAKSTSTLSIAAAGGTTPGYVISYTITNGKTGQLFAKRISY